MNCACLVHKTHDYFDKRVYVQLIRSTTRPVFLKLLYSIAPFSLSTRGFRPQD